ncbi:hypothetical protein C2845_PM15G09140 [Panicum miliaceum]|uniref:DUF6598 domain-containing protein n=1 Tax=Panicum miliaceum TaxID=4540 RepID=A0A3L6QCG3_PANMI|nr:hypothetical protein C2845_PM15G09140 [Panicum miliaceum]
MATISQVKGDESGKPNRLSSANVKHDTQEQIVKHIGSEEDGRSPTEDHMGKIVVSDKEEDSDDEGYTVNNILAYSRHLDGSIYRAQLEAMALSDPTDCIIHNGTCMEHCPGSMLQFFSLQLAKMPVDGGLVKLYGYMAVRDDVDALLNYIVNFSRDEPIIVEQGSLINLAGPKRGIDIVDFALIEYDMRIKTAEQEKDDLQLIDGATMIGPAGRWNCPFTIRIGGDSGAVDLTLSRLASAVEGTIEVLISEVQSSFNLSLACVTSGLSKEICLFDGAIAESCGLKRSGCCSEGFFDRLEIQIRLTIIQFRPTLLFLQVENPWE